jgi:hypothetical protein
MLARFAVEEERRTSGLRGADQRFLRWPTAFPEWSTSAW